jgi:hypothetical protein
MSDKNYLKRPDGIAEIFPVYPENISRQHPNETPESSLEHDLPFSSDNKNSLFCIQDSIALCDPDDNTVVEGIIAFEIRPESWTLIYVPTEKLMGFNWEIDDEGTQLQEFDYLHTPIERIHTGFQNHVLGIMQSCVDYMNSHPELSADIVDGIENTIRELNASSSTDFTVDIYLPPRICDLTGERYFRPGGELYSIFDNPSNDVDFDPSNSFKAFLKKIVTTDINQHGLTLSCDHYFPVENRMIEQEKQRELVNIKLQELCLSGKFKVVQHPQDIRETQRPPINNSNPQRRKVERPFIIPKHWHNDCF